LKRKANERREKLYPFYSLYCVNGRDVSEEERKI
jgi:hypothetical protein